MGLLSKDDIKELFFETMGNPVNAEESALYGRASVDALYIAIRRFAEEGVSFITENAFYASFAQSEFDSIVKDTGAGILQIFCYCNRDVHERRFTARIENGERHKGHYDQGGSLKNYNKIAETYKKLNNMTTFSVDTTTFGDKEYNRLLTQVKTLIVGS